jgi:hypothetical protein
MEERRRAAAGQAALDAGSPNSDGPGNRAWQDARAQLALVQAAEAARRN